VVVLTTYFSSRQIAQIHDRVRLTAETYAQLLSKQLQSAIAFGDRETAREVLDSLQIDDDIESAVVFTARGEALYTIGTPKSELAGIVRANAGRRGAVTSDGSIIAIGKIVSPEGPRGSVAVELSTARASANQRTVTWIGITVGGVAVLVGVVSAWLIARSLVRRLRKLSTAAAKVSNGELDSADVGDDSRDELGTLSRAFDRMVVQLRELFESIRMRTNELSDANARLVSEMADRAKMELELRHAQKLESIGRLASGVAHELNTPLQFVNDSCHFLRDALETLMDLHERIQGLVVAVHAGEVPHHDVLPVYEDARRMADADYLEDEVPEAITRAISGLQRMAQIVKSMKEFTHPARERTHADINRGLMTTLMIARSEYKHIADIKTDLGDVPRVLCEIGEINQVFLNLIVNAAHAIGDKVRGTGERGEIAVRSWVADGCVHVSISDTGTGIPDAIRDRIYDPFFTTKEVGRGTGQGLAIARSVVEKHQGKMGLRTEVGVGTTFTVVLPIGEPVPAARAA
jgi:signal transduction histidine kinase